MKKLFLFFLLLIPVPVFAVDQPYFNVTSATANSGSASVSVLNGTYPNNKEMRIDFSFLTFTDSYLKEVRVKMANNNLYNCNLGSVPVDLMKDTGRSRWAYIFTATCPINYNSNISEVVFDYFSTGSTDIILPHNLSVYSLNSSSGGSSADYTNQLQTIINNLNTNNTWNNYLYDQLNNNFPTIITKLETIHQDLLNSNTNVVNAINAQTQQQQQQNQIINNTDTSNNSTDFSNVINNNTLPNNSHAFDILGGLQGLINGLQPSGSCTRVSVPIPFTNQTLVLPCMTTDVYSVHFPELVVIWQLIVRGIGYYYILVNILRLVKETIDPFNFKLEVMDL